MASAEYKCRENKNLPAAFLDCYTSDVLIMPIMSAFSLIRDNAILTSSLSNSIL